jgi:hypothetical protein
VAFIGVVAGLVATNALAQSTDPQELDPRELLEQMSAEIAGLDNFIVHGEAYADARLDAGQIIEHSSQVKLRLQRDPGAVRISNRNAEDNEEIYFDNGTLSVYTRSNNMYAQTEIPKGVDSMFDFAVNEVGIEAPLLDFVASDVAAGLLQDSDEVRYLGTSLIRDEVYHHIGIRLRETDVQIWIAAKGPALPGKLAISSKWDGGSPRFVAFLKWDTKPAWPKGLFKFVPPKDAVEVDFLLNVQQ